MKKEWDEIRDNIRNEVKTEFMKRGRNHNTINKLIDLFIKVVLFPIEDLSLNLEGVEARMPNALQKVLIETNPQSDKLLAFPDFVKIEPFLKKIYYLLSPTDYIENRNRLTLSPLISRVNINPSGISYRNDTFNQLIDNPHFGEHLFRVYNLRNTESHVCKKWNLSEFYNNLQSSLIIFLFTIEQNYNSIQAAIDPDPNFQEYVVNIKTKFTKTSNFFIPIDGEELNPDNSSKFEIFIVETASDEDDYYNIESDDDLYLENDISQKRSGKISDIATNLKQFIVTGDPGSGKSTILKHLALSESNRGNKIPIFVELKSFDLDNSLASYIRNTFPFEITNNKWNDMISRNKFSFYLDGFNEVIDINARKRLRDEIRTLLGKYPFVTCILSTRNVTELHKFKIPVFKLIELDNVQILDFIRKHFQNDERANSLFQLLKKKKRLLELSKNPFMLNLLINVVKRNQSQIPENTGVLVRTFFHYLLIREENKNEHFRKDELLFLLKKLAFKTRIEKKVSFSKDTIFQIFSEEKIKLGLDLNLISTLDKLIEINILDTSQNLFHFSHELFQEYFMAEELVSYVVDKKINYANFVNKPYLNEPLFFCGGLLSKTQRVNFYKGINENSSKIAAKAYKHSSINEKAKKLIIYKAIERASNITNIKTASDGLAALSLLGEKEYFIKIISKIIDETQNYKNLHKIFRSFVLSMELEEIEGFLQNALAIQNKHISSWILQFIARDGNILNETSINKFFNDFIAHYIQIIKDNKTNNQVITSLIYIIASKNIVFQNNEDEIIDLLIEHGLIFYSSIPFSILLLKKKNILHKYDKSYLCNLVLDKCKKKGLFSILDLELTKEPKKLYETIALLEKKWYLIGTKHIYLSVAVELLINYEYGYDSYLVKVLENLITSSNEGYKDYVRIKAKYPKLNGLFSEIEIIEIILSNPQTVSLIEIAEKLIAKNNLEDKYSKIEIARRIILNRISNRAFLSGIRYIRLRELEENITLHEVLELAFDEYNYHRNFRIIQIIKALILTYNTSQEQILKYLKNKKYSAIITNQEGNRYYYKLRPFNEFGILTGGNYEIGQEVTVTFKKINQNNKKVLFKLKK